MKTVEIGQALAARGLPALVWNMEELDAEANATISNDGIEIRRGYGAENSTGVGETGVRYQRCGGGRRVIRRKKGGE